MKMWTTTEGVSPASTAARKGLMGLYNLVLKFSKNEVIEPLGLGQYKHIL